MTTKTCEQCGKKFHKHTVKQAEAALRMHIGRKHGTVKIRAERGEVRTRSNDETETPVAHFCPGCGMNLHVLHKAMSLANRVKGR